MNPNGNSEAIKLPAPVEQAPKPGNGEKQTSAESAPGGERAAQAAPAPMPTSIPLPTQPTIPQVSGQASASSNASNPAQASDDSDLIEKEWVDKAKAIVERTRDDPHKQSEELTVFKADYMKKRYNRPLKLSK